MTQLFLICPLAFGFATPVLAQLSGSESAWIGQAAGGISFGLLFALLLRWLTGKWDARQEELVRETRAMRQTLTDTIGDWNRVQLLQLAERSLSEEIRERAKHALAERERRDKSASS